MRFNISYINFSSTITSILGLKMFQTDKQIISEVEVMQMLKKGQPQQGVKSVQSEVEFTNKKHLHTRIKYEGVFICIVLWSALK